MPRRAKQDRRVLHAYLRQQQLMETDLIHVLEHSASEVDKQLRKIRGKQSLSATVERAQLNNVKRELRMSIKALWKQIGMTVMAHREDTAIAAAKSMEPYDDILRKAGLTAEKMAGLHNAEIERAKRGIVNALNRMNYTSIPFSKRVLQSDKGVQAILDRMINQAIARGVSWRELSKIVQNYVDPATRGGVRYAADRIARTELNNVFHATQVNNARGKAWITGMLWELSASHPRSDECDDYAEDAHIDGGDAGVFRVEDVPMQPHPNCYCFLTPVTVKDEDFLDALVKTL